MSVRLRPTPGERRCQNGVIRNEVRRLGLFVERVRPHPVRSLVAVKLIDQLLVRTILFPPDRGEEVNLPVQIDHVLRLVRHCKVLHDIALAKPLFVAGLSVKHLKRLPTLRGDLKRADLGLAAVRLIARQLFTSW